MRVLLLGSTGRVAEQAIPILQKSRVVGQVVMAGRDAGRVRERRDELAIGAEVVQADATDPYQVALAAADCDVVLNLAGLDDVTPLSASQGALDSGCHYVDVGASALAVEALLTRSKEFEAAGLSCMPSIGGAPGLAGLLACHAASVLDVCDAVTINLGLPLARWGDPKVVARSYSGGTAVLQSHISVLGLFSRPAPILRDGHVRWVQPSEHASSVSAPDGRCFTAMPVGSPEAFTIPIALPEVKRVDALWSLWPEETMTRFSRSVENDDLEDAVRAAYQDLASWDDDRLHLPPEFREPAFWSQANGQLEGHARSVRCSIPNHLTPSTAGVACTAAILLGTDASVRRGVAPAEACFEIDAFLEHVYENTGIEIADPVVTVDIR